MCCDSDAIWGADRKYVRPVRKVGGLSLCCPGKLSGLNRISHPHWVKICDDHNGQINLRTKQKHEVLSATHLKNFRPFWKTVYNNQVVEIFQWTNKIDVDPRPRSIGFWPGAEFYGRSLCGQSTTFAGFYCILDVSVRICPIDRASHEAFHTWHPGMADRKFF